MAETYKTLGQSAPSATTATMLYAVPAAGSTVCSSILVCNRGPGSTKFRISLRVAGEAENSKQYLYYDVPIPAYDTFIATIGISMAETDELWVYAEEANLTFQAWGAEVI